MNLISLSILFTLLISSISSVFFSGNCYEYIFYSQTFNILNVDIERAPRPGDGRRDEPESSSLITLSQIV